MYFLVELWGKYGCFTRPELKVERMSYEVITPSAVRGVMESIYWHPGVKYVTDRIYVLNKPKYISIKTNELKSKGSASNVKKMILGGEVAYQSRNDQISQRSSLILKDPHYVVELHIEVTDEAAPGDGIKKFENIFQRRLETGQCFLQPYFGMRQFPAYFRPWTGGSIKTANINRNLGLMLYDMNYSNPENITPCFFDAKIRDGVVNVAGERILR